MADIVVETGAGLTNSNSYCTVDEADTYHEDHLYYTDWTTASEDTKERALVWATRLLDEKMEWEGLVSNQDQALFWPRMLVYDRNGYSIGSSSIPQFLKDAVAEFARLLIAEDRTSETNRDLVGFKELEIDVLKIKVDTYQKKSVLPPSVWSIVRFYGHRTHKKRTLVRI